MFESCGSDWRSAQAYTVTASTVFVPRPGGENLEGVALRPQGRIPGESAIELYAR
jgi:hypothetical protein